MAFKDIGNFVGGFGQGLTQALQFQQQLKQKQEQFQSQLNFDERQLQLKDALGWAGIKNDQTQMNINKEKYSGDLANDYVNVPQGTEGSISGGDLQKQYPTLGSAFNPELSYLDKDLVAKESKPEKPEVTLLRSGWGQGFMNDYYGYKDAQGNEVVTKVDRRNPAPKQTSGDGSSESKSKYKEKPLSEKGTASLVQLQNPNSGFLGTGLGGTSKQDVGTYLNVIMTDVLDSGETSWFQEIFNTKGYVSPKELTNLALERDDLDFDKVNTFLNYYETFYDNIKDF